MYRNHELRGLSEARRERWFERVDGSWRVTPRLREHVSVQRANLLSDPPPMKPGTAQAVLCRNVFIYLRRDRMAACLDRLHQVLVPGGRLFIGGSESLYGVEHRFVVERANGVFVHRRLAAPAAVETKFASPPVRVDAVRPAVRPVEPLPTAADLREVGEQAARTGRHADAVAAFRKVAYLDPTDPVAHLELGLALEAGGDEGAGRRAFQAARRALDRSAPEGLSVRLDGLEHRCARVGPRHQAGGRAVPVMVRFDTAQGSWAVGVEHTIEVRPVSAVRPLPSARPGVAGVIDRERNAVPVVHTLGDDGRHVLVLQAGGITIGMLVTEVTGVVKVPATRSVRPLPARTPRSSAPPCAMETISRSSSMSTSSPAAWEANHERIPSPHPHRRRLHGRPGGDRQAARLGRLRAARGRRRRRRASAACRSSAPDVVLLDVEMPGQTGYDVLSAMQAEPELAGIPVIFLSGQVSAEHVATGLRLGAHDYLRKPVETGELLARVTAALRTKVLQDRLRRDNAQLRQLAPIDPLTGVLDVRGLQERLEALAEDARLHGRCLAGVLLDVQALDSINNAFGWAAGDEVLRSLAELVSGMIAPGEVVGRCGPDEFLILLPNTDLVTADALSRSLQARVGSSSVRVGGDDVAVRIAVGAAATEDGSAEALVRSLQEAITTGVARPAGGRRPSPGRRRRPPRWRHRRRRPSRSRRSSPPRRSRRARACPWPRHRWRARPSTRSRRRATRGRGAGGASGGNE